MVRCWSLVLIILNCTENALRDYNKQLISELHVYTPGSCRSPMLLKGEFKSDKNCLFQKQHVCMNFSTAMVELDGDDIRVSSRGKLAERDIVQVNTDTFTA